VGPDSWNSARSKRKPRSRCQQPATFILIRFFIDRNSYLIESLSTAGAINLWVTNIAAAATGAAMRFRTRVMALSGTLLVSGCVHDPHIHYADGHDLVRVDGVEYIAPASGPRSNEPTTPHLKPDGTPYTCNY